MADSLFRILVVAEVSCSIVSEHVGTASCFANQGVFALRLGTTHCVLFPYSLPSPHSICKGVPCNNSCSQTRWQCGRNSKPRCVISIHTTCKPIRTGSLLLCYAGTTAYRQTKHKGRCAMSNALFSLTDTDHGCFLIFLGTRRGTQDRQHS